MTTEQRDLEAGADADATGGTPVSPAGDTPPDQDAEPPRTADDGSEGGQAGEAPPSSHPASPGALH